MPKKYQIACVKLERAKHARMQMPAFIISVLELVFNGQVILGNWTKDPEYQMNKIDKLAYISLNHKFAL